MIQQWAVGAVCKTNDFIFQMVLVLMQLIWNYSSWLVRFFVFPLFKESANNIWRPSKTHFFSVRAKCVKAAIRSVDLIVIEQQSRLPFPSCHGHLSVLHEAIQCQYKWRVAILDLNACGPSLFLLCLSWKINASAGCNKTPHYCS